MNKIVDTFLYNAEYEKSVLLCKLHAEYDYVDELIALESAYDFRGNYKGLTLKELVWNDPDFDLFREKLIIVQSEDNLFEKLKCSHQERDYFKVEFDSRALAHSYLCTKYEDNDWVILSDVDEHLDFSSTDRRAILMEGFNNSTKSIQWQNYKFWWDFDNLNLDPLKYIPCHKLGFLKERGYAHRNNDCQRLEPELVCGLEYAYCFPIEGNWNKVSTFAHDRYRLETLENALLFNTFHKESQRGEQLQSPYDFFETIEIDERNASRYVLDTLPFLKVNTVECNYGNNRISRFNIYPHPAEQAGLLRGNRIRRDRHYYRRGK